MWFQSPRSGKFVSNKLSKSAKSEFDELCFNPLDRGNLYLIRHTAHLISGTFIRGLFQSPRSGKFISNLTIYQNGQYLSRPGFNPLDRGNLYLILRVGYPTSFLPSSFNPLDRGNLYLIA